MASDVDQERVLRALTQYDEILKGECRMKMRFVDYNPAELQDETIEFIKTVVEPTGLDYKMGNVRVAGTVLFSIGHPRITHLLHDPISRQRFWIGDCNILNHEYVISFFQVLKASRSFDFAGGDGPPPWRFTAR